MKKIGILTFQYADNYGAVLQCYALKTMLEGFDGYEVEVINYRPINWQYEKRWTNSFEEKAFWEKRSKFECFLKERCGIAEQECSVLIGDKYDIYCVGSDQVWNTQHGVKDFFLPNISDNCKKITYAVSVGIAPDNKQIEKMFFEKYASKFDYISVREQEHINMLNHLTGKCCERVLDPTFLPELMIYNFGEDDRKLKPEEYIFFFWIENDDNLDRGISEVNRMAREYGIPVIHSLYGEKGDRIFSSLGTMIFEGPDAFIEYIKNATVVLTNSYHAAIFALRFHKRFFVVPGEGMESRFRNLADLFPVKNAYIKKIKTEYKKVPELNYEEIEALIDTEREKSLNFLRKILCEK